MNLTRRFLTAAVTLLTLPLFAQTEKQRETGLDHLVKLDRETRLTDAQVPLAAALAHLPAPQRNAWNAFNQRAGGWQVILERRTALPLSASGRGIPTIPGRGNTLTVDQVNARLAGLAGSAAPTATSVVGDLVDSNRFNLTQIDTLTRDFIRQNQPIFSGINPATLALSPYRSGSFGENGYLWFIDYDQLVNGIPVDGARLTFRYNHGNLVQFGSEKWGRVRPDATTATVTPAQALQLGKDYIGGWDDRLDKVISAPALKLVAAVSHADLDEFERGYRGTPGRGLFNHKLLYDMTLRRAGQTGTYLVRISGLNGEVLEMRDINDYGTVKGGVYPGAATSKGTNVNVPLGFANYGSGVYADAFGNFSGTTGTTSLIGRYVKVADSCGAVSASADGSGLLNLGSNTGTDCTTPGSGGAGNTNAARTGYYHTDLIKQKIRSFLPSNSWNNGQLTMNLNLNQTCNAYWNGSTINFFRSGGGCGNTGELPDVFLHEFGHGLDSFDNAGGTGGGTSHDGGTGEAYGDVTALTMGHHSCTGAGFLSANCGGYGDACTNCTGIREIDYRKRAQNTPWTATKNANNCPAGSSCLGPMGKECHCEAYPLTGANWELSLTMGTKYGSGAGWNLLDKLFYLSRSTTGAGFNKITATTANGCGSSNWLNAYLVVDDDNGNLADGTPNASQIQAAYNSHGIGCSTMTSTSTQSGASLATPSLSSSSTASSVTLSWGAVSGAANFGIYKNSLGCSAGFVRQANATGTSYVDNAVASVGTYYYAVQAVGSVASSISQFSNCIAVTPSGATTSWAVSGTVTDSTSAGISGVTVSYSGGSTSTSSTGAWTISGVSNGSYTFTPSKAGYTFSPANRAVTMASANVTGQNFTGTATTTTYSISGAAGTASATVNFSGASSGSAVADGSGNYTISSLVAGSYTLTPAKSGCTFSPTSLAVTVGPSATGRNFTATCGGTGATALSKNVAASSSTNSTSANSDYKDFTLAVPSGASNLVINTTSAGDVDLYVKFGAAASLTVYDCRPYTGSGAESCSFATPSVGTYNIRVYGYATGAVSFTVKGDWTVGGGGGPQVERLSNIGFESGNNGVWVLSGTASAFGISTTGAYPRTGTSYGFLGNNTVSSNYTMAQTVSIPSTATAGSVSFWLNIYTGESLTDTNAWDTLTASIKNTAGTTLCTLATYSNANHTNTVAGTVGPYAQRSFTLSAGCITAIKGQSVQLHFTGTNDGSLTTTFRVDDTTLKTD